MARLTPQACISARTAPPSIPPWRSITTRQLQDWLGVSENTIYGWHRRRNGPRRSMSKSRIVTFVLADVLEWLDGVPAHEHIRQWWLAPGYPARAGWVKVMRLNSKSDEELISFCEWFDANKFFSRSLDRMVSDPCPT